MGAYKKAVITDAGRALVARAVAGETEIRFSHASTSEYVYPDGTRFEEIEKLEGIRQTVLPADARVADGTLVNVRAMFGNENILSPYMIQNIGLYAMDGEREILFAVSQAQVPDQVPAYNGVAPSSFIFNPGTAPEDNGDRRKGSRKSDNRYYDSGLRLEGSDLYHRKCGDPGRQHCAYRVCVRFGPGGPEGQYTGEDGSRKADTGGKKSPCRGPGRG